MASALLCGQTHLESNPVYRDLVETGVAIHADFKQTLPAPIMSDGLDAQAQEAIIKREVVRAYPMSKFLRKSVVAPHILQMNSVDTGDPQYPGRQVDFWFVAYGDLETISNRDFLDRLLKAGEEKKGEDDEGKGMTEDELAERGITISAEDADFEHYGHADYTLIEKVRLSLTGHSYWSRTTDSIITAAKVDRRFQGDAEFPNQWRSISRNDLGRKVYGAPVQYEEAALYAKITRLASPTGALFVECHVLFSEPHGWFDGHNLLASKLPPVVQSRVRSARRELMRAGGR
jgi:hypothetical protein